MPSLASIQNWSRQAQTSFLFRPNMDRKAAATTRSHMQDSKWANAWKWCPRYALERQWSCRTCVAKATRAAGCDHCCQLARGQRRCPRQWLTQRSGDEERLAGESGSKCWARATCSECREFGEYNRELLPSFTHYNHYTTFDRAGPYTHYRRTITNVSRLYFFNSKPHIWLRMNSHSVVKKSVFFFCKEWSILTRSGTQEKIHHAVANNRYA